MLLEGQLKIKDAQSQSVLGSYLLIVPEGSLRSVGLVLRTGSARSVDQDVDPTRLRPSFLSMRVVLQYKPSGSGAWLWEKGAGITH